MLIPEIVAGLILLVVLVALFRIDAGVQRVSESLERVAKALESGAALRPEPPRSPLATRASQAEIAAAIAAARLAADAKAAAHARAAAPAPVDPRAASASAAAYDGKSGGLVDVFGDLDRGPARADRAGRREGGGK
jgi:membrane protein involved in colicin uptake